VAARTDRTETPMTETQSSPESPAVKDFMFDAAESAKHIARYLERLDNARLSLRSDSMTERAQFRMTLDQAMAAAEDLQHCLGILLRQLAPM
jgi:hypothetical protein